LQVGKVISNLDEMGFANHTSLNQERNPYTVLWDALREYRTKYAEEDKAIDLVEKAKLSDRQKHKKTKLPQREVKKGTAKSEQQSTEVKLAQNKEGEPDNITFMENLRPIPKILS